MSEQLSLIDGYKLPITEGQKPRSPYQKWKKDNNYRKSDSKNKRCGNCKNITSQNGYYKCILLGTSSSSATDIRLSNVCNQFAVKYADCQLCKHLDCNTNGDFICGLDGDILDHEGIYCSNFVEYK